MKLTFSLTDKIHWITVVIDFLQHEEPRYCCHSILLTEFFQKEIKLDWQLQEKFGWSFSLFFDPIRQQIAWFNNII